MLANVVILRNMTRIYLWSVLVFFHESMNCDYNSKCQIVMLLFLTSNLADGPINKWNANIMEIMKQKGHFGL